MKGKQHSDKSDKNKQKVKQNLKIKQTKDCSISNSYLANFDSKQKSNNINSSIKRSKVKFNSTKKQSDNLTPPSEKFGSSERQSNTPSKAILAKKKLKLAQIKNLQQKYANVKLVKNTNEAFSNTADLKHFKDNTKNKSKNASRGISASIDGTSYHHSKFKLDAPKREVPDPITYSNDRKAPKQNLIVNSSILSKYTKGHTKRKSVNKREIPWEFKHIKNNSLHKSSKVIQLTLLEISKYIKELKKKIKFSNRFN